VNADSNNKTIQVHTEDTIEISLNETPTAGYEWVIDNLSGDVCKLQSSGYKPNASGAVGGSGMRTMVFVIIKTGKGHIKLKNWQRWSGDIYKNFEISIQSE
jgi:predicted secreted protein